jgi:hypothetical protein
VYTPVPVVYRLDVDQNVPDVFKGTVNGTISFVTSETVEAESVYTPFPYGEPYMYCVDGFVDVAPPGNVNGGYVVAGRLSAVIVGAVPDNEYFPSSVIVGATALPYITSVSGFVYETVASGASMIVFSYVYKDTT